MFFGKNKRIQDDADNQLNEWSMEWSDLWRQINSNHQWENEDEMNSSQVIGGLAFLGICIYIIHWIGCPATANEMVKMFKKDMGVEIGDKVERTISTYYERTKSVIQSDMRHGKDNKAIFNDLGREFLCWIGIDYNEDDVSRVAKAADHYCFIATCYLNPER